MKTSKITQLLITVLIEVKVVLSITVQAMVQCVIIAKNITISALWKSSKQVLIVSSKPNIDYKSENESNCIINIIENFSIDLVVL